MRSDSISQVPYRGDPPPRSSMDEDAILMLDNRMLSGGDITITPLSQFLQQPTLILRKGSSQFPIMYHHPSVGGVSCTNPGPGTANAINMEDDQLIDVDYISPSLIKTLVMTVVGLALGIGLRYVPDGSSTKHILKWIGWFGEVWGRGMNCLTIPLMFTSVVCCVCHLTISQKATGVLTRTMVSFTMAALLACIITCGVAFAFGSHFNLRDPPLFDPAPISVNIQCPNEKFLINTVNATAPGAHGEFLACVAPTKDSKDSTFKIVDLSGLKLPHDEGYDVKNPVSLAKQIANFFDVLFPSNIMKILTIQEMLSIFTFATILGVAIVRTHEINRAGYAARSDGTGGEASDRRPSEGPSEQVDGFVAGENYVYMLIKQTNCVLEVILNWMIPWMPLALASSLTSFVALNDVSSQHLDATAFVFVAFTVSFVLFALIACLAYWLFLRKSPFSLLSYLTPALLYLLVTSDSIASLPLFYRAIDATKQVSRTLSQTVLSVGMIVSLSATASYWVLVCIYMAYTSGYEHQFTGGRLIELILVSTLISLMGASPIPGSALLRLITIWVTVFDSSPAVPGSFAFIAWVEVYFMRLRRMQNFIVIAFTAHVLADQLDESVEDEDARRESDAEIRLARL